MDLLKITRNVRHVNVFDLTLDVGLMREGNRGAVQTRVFRLPKRGNEWVKLEFIKAGLVQS